MNGCGVSQLFSTHLQNVAVALLTMRCCELNWFVVNIDSILGFQNVSRYIHMTSINLGSIQDWFPWNFAWDGCAILGHFVGFRQHPGLPHRISSQNTEDLGRRKSHSGVCCTVHFAVQNGGTVPRKAMFDCVEERLIYTKFKERMSSRGAIPRGILPIWWS